jgi:hypothetical protein
MKHYIKKISNYSIVGSIGILTVFLLAGCDNKKNENKQAGGDKKLAEAGKTEGQFLVIQETAPGKYKVVEQYPSNGPSRAILKDMNGTEKLLSEAELKTLAEAEAKKVENNTSNLTRAPQDASMHGGGMSLGETILAGAAGALIGGYIANKLFSNPNFQANQRVAAPSAVSKPVGGYKPGTPGAAPHATTPAAGAPKPAAPQSGYFKDTAKPASSPAPSGTRPSAPASSGGHTSSGG